MERVAISAAASGLGVGPVGVGIDFYKSASLLTKGIELLLRVERQQIAELIDRAMAAGLVSLTKGSILPWRPMASCYP